MAARELGWLPLESAMALCALLAEKANPQFDAAAVRWLGRFALERSPSLVESAAVLAALSHLPDDRAVDVLRAALRRR
jgi:hypothetical protein